MSERFARVCPTHHQVLDELHGGRLACPRSPHRVAAWIVVELETGEVLGAGRRSGKWNDSTRGVWLGPRLQLTADVLLDLGEKRYALPVPAHRAAA